MLNTSDFLALPLYSFFKRLLYDYFVFENRILISGGGRGLHLFSWMHRKNDPANIRHSIFLQTTLLRPTANNRKKTHFKSINDRIAVRSCKTVAMRSLFPIAARIAANSSGKKQFSTGILPPANSTFDGQLVN